MSLRLFLDVYVAMIGLLVGSYLNVVIYRLPRRRSTVLPRSYCPHCGALIRAYDNIPLLSYLLLLGKCRSCRAPIAWRYPLVEALTSVGFLTCFELYGVSLAALAGAILWGLLLALAAIDIEHRLLPDVLTLPGIAIGLALQPWLPWSTLAEAALAVVLGGGAVYLGLLAWERWRGVSGMGRGDAKMVAMIGAFLGIEGLLVATLIASLAALAVAAARIALGRTSAEVPFPFGPYLACGATAVFLLYAR